MLRLADEERGDILHHVLRARILFKPGHKV
jgi:hypothetical protein